MTTMRAAVLLGAGRVEVTDVPVPEPAPGEVLVRSFRATICGSDLHKVFGGLVPKELPTPPGYPGHEGMGEVVASRSDRVRPGEWVLAVPPDDRAGTFAEYHVVSDAFVVPLPAADERLLLAQQLGTVLFALKRFWPYDEPPVSAAVLGTGPAGLQFVQALKRRGVRRIIAADLQPNRLAAARRFGADTTVQVPHEDAVEATLAATDGAGADLVVEAAGHDLTRAQAMAAVRKYGRVGLFGLPEHHGPVAFPFTTMFRLQPTVETCVGAQFEPGLSSFREAVELIHAGSVDVEGMITRTYGLGDILEALTAASDRTAEVLKVGVRFDD